MYISCFCYPSWVLLANYTQTQILSSNEGLFYSLSNIFAKPAGTPNHSTIRNIPEEQHFSFFWGMPRSSQVCQYVLSSFSFHFTGEGLTNYAGPPGSPRIHSNQGQWGAEKADGKKNGWISLHCVHNTAAWQHHLLHMAL